MRSVSSDDLLLQGFAFSGYRSFTEPGMPIAPLSKVNLLAGQNNAGKSNVLRFLRDLLKDSPTAPSSDVDRPEHVLPQDWQVRLQLIMPDFHLPDGLITQQSSPHVAQSLAALRSAPDLWSPAGVAFPYVLAPVHPQYGDRDVRHWALDVDAMARVAEHIKSRGINVMQAANAITGSTYVAGLNDAMFTTEMVDALAPDLTALPPVRVIQAFRQIRPSDGNDDENSVGLFDGVGLVKRLQQLESPRQLGAKRDEMLEKYEQINAFVRHILDDDSATLHVPYDASTVQVQRGRSVLPLDSLGTGVHQVVMLAAAATLLNHTIVGLEEPEVHLHPLLQ